jgi:predicted transcriptional regulator
MTNELNTSNPEAMLYETEEIRFTILGGIRLEGLDRMRVTLKMEVINRKYKYHLNNPDIADLALRQNLDLYNDTQVEKLIRKAAERLEIGSTALAKCLADITTQAENWRLHHIEQLAHATAIKTKVVTEEDRKTAIDFLSKPNLMQRTNDAIGKSGVIGEELNRLLMFIIFTSRKLNHPLHIVSLGSSGTGKTHLQEKVSELIPEEDKLEITTLSENAFYYFGQRELSGKLILIEDLDGAMNVLFPLRELQSKKRISKTVTFKDTRGITKTITLTVEGPVSVAGCTTKEKIYEDNANRSFLIYLDENETQDEAIMQHQKMRSAGLVNTQEEIKIRQILQNCQRLLQPIHIRNPYAPQLQLPKDVFKPRRTNKHYLDFIEAVSFYHQFQREQKADESTGEVYIETSLEDIAEANKLMKEILLRKSDGISGACRNYFETLKEYLQANKENTFTNRSTGQALRMAHSTVKRHHLELATAGLIKRKDDKKEKTYWYEITSSEEYEQLKNRIATVLDAIYTILVEQEQQQQLSSNQPNGSNRLSSKSEPIKTVITKRKSPSAQQLTGGYPDPKKITEEKITEETAKPQTIIITTLV